VLLDFFPSPTLTWYIGKTFAIRILAVLFMLVVVLMMLDLLSRTGDILAHPDNGEAQLLHYVSLRIPQLVSRFLPYSVLLATIITLTTFNQNSEVVAMKAAGLSAHQILAPLVLVALAVAVLSFAFNERIVIRANASLKSWEDVDYGPIPPPSRSRANIYLNDGNDVLLASRIEGTGPDTVMHGVTFYERDEAGMIQRQVRAPIARYADPGWRLEKPRLFDVGPADTRELPGSVVVAQGLTLDQVALERVDPDAESIGQLFVGPFALVA